MAKIKKNYKTCSINIEESLMEKITALQGSVYSKLSITQIVNSALTEFFDFNSEYGAFINAAKGEILIPREKYGLLFSLDALTIKNKIARGSLTEINIGDLKYIRLADDDFKNVFVHVHKLKEDLSKLEENYSKISNKVSSIEDKLKY